MLPQVLPLAARCALTEVVGLGVHLSRYASGVRGRGLRPTPPSGGQALETPVLLVHGFLHNRSAFSGLADALRDSGVRWVWPINYDVLDSLDGVAGTVARCVDETLRKTGASRVDVVGHSLGGIAARWYVQELGGHRHVRTCVTIAAPHAGTILAHAAIGRAARRLRPGSDALERLALSLPSTPCRFVNVYAPLDPMVVPASSARLPDGPNVENHGLDAAGHASLLLQPAVHDAVVRAVAVPVASVKDEPRRTRAA